jgi:hypothetical protein
VNQKITTQGILKNYPTFATGLVTTNESLVIDRSTGRGVNFFVIAKSAVRNQDAIDPNFQGSGFNYVGIPSADHLPTVMTHLLVGQTLWEGLDAPEDLTRILTDLLLPLPTIDSDIRRFAEFLCTADLVPIENTPINKQPLRGIAGAATGGAAGLLAIKAGAVTGIAIIFVTPLSIVFCAAAAIGAHYMWHEYRKKIGAV